MFSCTLTFRKNDNWQKWSQSPQLLQEFPGYRYEEERNSIQEWFHTVTSGNAPVMVTRKVELVCDFFWTLRTARYDNQFIFWMKLPASLPQCRTVQSWSLRYRIIFTTCWSRKRSQSRCPVSAAQHFDDSPSHPVQTAASKWKCVCCVYVIIQRMLLLLLLLLIRAPLHCTLPDNSPSTSRTFGNAR